MENNGQLLKPLLLTVNDKRNYELVKLKSNLDYSKKEIPYLKNQIVNHKKTIAEYEEKLKGIKDRSWELQDLMDSLEQLKKNKNVDWAFVTRDLHLIVQTKPLLQYDGIQEKQLTEPVGRYAFKIDLRYGSRSIFPLDFIAGAYRHPNLMYAPGDACWGNFSVGGMISSGEYFNAIDGMINFFSTFPQEKGGGHAPLYWLTWLNDRRIDFKQNPWIDYKPIMQIGEVKSAEPIEFKMKKILTAVIDGRETVLDGLQFKNY